MCCSLYVQCSLLHVSGAMFLAREWRTGHADCKPAFRADPSSATRRRQADDIDAPVAHFRSAVYRKSESKWVAHSFAKLDLTALAARGAIFGARRRQADDIDSDTDVESVASWVGEAPAAHLTSKVLCTRSRNRSGPSVWLSTL